MVTPFLLPAQTSNNTVASHQVHAEDDWQIEIESNRWTSFLYYYLLIAQEQQPAAAQMDGCCRAAEILMGIRTADDGNPIPGNIQYAIIYYLRGIHESNRTVTNNAILFYWPSFRLSFSYHPFNTN